MKLKLCSSKENKAIEAVSKSILVLFFTLGTLTIANAAPVADTSKKIVAPSEKKESVEIVSQESNVVFPQVLTGNEEESLKYIEKFSENRRAYIIRTYN